jgi:hypothetical protein
MSESRMPSRRVGCPARRVAVAVVLVAGMIVAADAVSAQDLPSAVTMPLRPVFGQESVASVTGGQALQARPSAVTMRLRPVFGQQAVTSATSGQSSSLAADHDGSCPGCPKRRVALAIAEVLGVNLFYNGFSVLFKPEDQRFYFKTYPKIWWNNITYGFEWDDNTFQVNQFGHPYNGNNYFNAGRANGLSFWESVPLAALGSLTWEYMGERHKPSVNDLVMTTLGGISLGEMFHRTAWLIRDTKKTGKGRFLSEFAAMVVDPVTGLNRMIDGSARQVTEKPPGMVPDVLFAAVDAGVLWRGEDTRVRQASGEPFAQIALGYGTMPVGNSREPYDAFRLDIRFGGGGPISEATVRGRLVGRQLSEGPEGAKIHGTQFSVNQTYDYQNNSAYQYGGQGFQATLNHRRSLGGTFSLTSSASVGVIALGAMDSLYVDGPDRQYDYGPGLNYTVSALLLRKGLPFMRAAYGGLWLHTVDGAQVDHVAQAVRVDVLIPLKGLFALGTSAEFVQRKSYYDKFDDIAQKFPQFRVYLSWLNR